MNFIVFSRHTYRFLPVGNEFNHRYHHVRYLQCGLILFCSSQCSESWAKIAFTEVGVHTNDFCVSPQPRCIKLPTISGSVSGTLHSVTNLATTKFILSKVAAINNDCFYFLGTFLTLIFASVKCSFRNCPYSPHERYFVLHPLTLYEIPV